MPPSGGCLKRASMNKIEKVIEKTLDKILTI